MSEDNDDFDAIIAELRRSNRKARESLDMLQFDSQIALGAAEGLYRYIGIDIKDSKQSVIYSIIEDALKHYEAELVRDNSDGSKRPNYTGLGAFIDGLLTESCEKLMACGITAGNSVWRLGHEKSLSQWREENTGDVQMMAIHHQDVLATRAALYEHIASDRIKFVLNRVGYEDAVVSGSVAADC